MTEIINEFDNNYLELCKKVINNGFCQYNERTKKKCLTIFGDYREYDLSTGKFPLFTCKQMDIKPIAAELLGFIRGYDNASLFREAGTKIWDANANKTQGWLNNPNRKGEDDLGRIYGVQARDWKKPDGSSVDQLKSVVERLNKRSDDRRLIVSHWNVGELDQMALPPCHAFYIFGIENDKLNLAMIQRSADCPLGVNFNIASYSLLLLLMCRITGLKPGKFCHFIWNAHIYQDQMDGMSHLITRKPFEAPEIIIDERIKTLDDLETWATTDCFKIVNYKHHPKIVFPFSE
jgi:thymidylate synthase